MGIRALSAAAALTAVIFVIAGCAGMGTDTAALPMPSNTSSSSGATANVTITIVGMNAAQSYAPNPATVKVGQTVSWVNADTVTHTATNDAGAFNSGNIAPGTTSAPVRMNTAGTFDYHCTIHPTMVGTLTVTP